MKDPRKNLDDIHDSPPFSPDEIAIIQYMLDQAAAEEAAGLGEP